MARSLDVGSDGNAGHLRLGFDASLDGKNTGYTFGTIDYAQHIKNTPLGELSAFARGFGGARIKRGRWTSQLGVTGGLELSW